jgi:hypothetical protein
VVCHELGGAPGRLPPVRGGVEPVGLAGVGISNSRPGLNRTRGLNQARPPPNGPGAGLHGIVARVARSEQRHGCVTGSTGQSVSGRNQPPTGSMQNAE